MSCADVETWLHPFVDGELDLVRHVEVERHLAGCERCTRLLEGHKALRVGLKERVPYYRAPAGLEARLRSALREAEAPGRRLARQRRWLGLAAALAVAAVGIWSLGRNHSLSSVDETLAQELTANHVRSLMADHLTDVAASDRHVVKPWFNGKLDFSPPVVDLAEQGFPLVGGRLDVLQGRPVAALVYGRHQHRINLFVSPSRERADHLLREAERDGYQLVGWTGAGMAFWAVSDLNLAELREFVRLLQDQVQ
jgi:anti-sigma factor RsiW